MTSFHEGMVVATYPLTWVSVSDGGGLKGSLAGQNYESSHLGSLKEAPVLGVESMVNS